MIKLYIAGLYGTFLPVNGITTETKNMKTQKENQSMIANLTNAATLAEIMTAYDTRKATLIEFGAFNETEFNNWFTAQIEFAADAEAMKNYHREVAAEKLNRFAQKN